MAGFVPVTIAGRAFRKGPTSESGLVFGLLRFAGGFQWQTLDSKVCHFSRPGADSGGSVSTEQGRIVSKMPEFAYELCHTKRRINADELARIT